MVKKKEGDSCMCIDFRALNKITTKDVYPLPNIEDLLASLNGAQYFTSLEMNKGCMQIGLSSESQANTASITQDGLYVITRMPFGLCNAPATFQRCIDSTLAGLKGNSCLVYLPTRKTGCWKKSNGPK